jgi:hypothetical protein
MTQPQLKLHPVYTGQRTGIVPHGGAVPRRCDPGSAHSHLASADTEIIPGRNFFEGAQILSRRPAGKIQGYYEKQAK